MKDQYKRTVLIRGMKLLYVLLMVGCFLICWNLYYAGGFEAIDILAGNVLMGCLYAGVIVNLMRIYQGFSFEMVCPEELMCSQTLANLVGAGIMYVIASICQLQWITPLPMIGMVILQSGISLGWSVAARKLFKEDLRAKKTVLLYRNQCDLKELDRLHHFKNRFDVQKLVEYRGQDYRQLLEELAGYEAVFAAGIPANIRNSVVKYCVECGVQGYFVPHIGDIIMAGAEYIPAFSVPMMKVQRTVLKPEYRFLKRGMDITLSLIAIILSSPFMLVTAIAIKAYDRGPVIYRQVRLTENGREFAILKFRSMKVNAEKDGIARLASANDDRITPVGKFIRAFRLDELPQLFNILNGDMSIVGPRPERPEIAAQYEKELPAFAMRLQVKAGLTGLAQVYGRYNTEPYNKLQMDLMYINNASILQDIKLMLATVKVLFVKESTEGVDAGQITAEKEKKPA